MEATEVRVKLMGGRDEKLQAFCTITFDNCFVVRDLKVIQVGKGAFVAMPSRKLTDLCPKCRGRNHLRARFCNDCGCPLNPERAPLDEKGRAKLHADIAHPINSSYREDLQRRILRAYADELLRAQQPGYRPPPDEFLDAGEDYDAEELLPPGPRPATLLPPPRVKPPHRFGEGILS